MHSVAVVAAKLADGKPWNGLGGPEGLNPSCCTRNDRDGCAT